MKSTLNTVFVRFSPASPKVNRWHLEDLFSGVGPIKKCSVISNKDKDGLGYGFVKFISEEDAVSSAEKYNDTYLEVEGEKYKLKVEVASTPVTKDSIKAENSKLTKEEIDIETLIKKKKTSRVILRNLSWYANEKMIKSAMEKNFGPLVEVTLPRVNDKLHRGFAFVTFQSVNDAKKATQERESPIQIKGRPVAIDFAVAKDVHLRKKKADAENPIDEDSDGDESNTSEKESDDIEDDNSNEDENKSDASSKSQSDTSSDDDTTKDESEEGEDSKKQAPVVDEAVNDKKTVFIRNLPFDMTRHDIFELMRQFGTIESIHPVTDRETQVSKGSAFCEFKKHEFALKALEAASSSVTTSKQQDFLSGDDGLSFRGRRLFIDMAVDKQTASTLALQKEGGAEKAKGKDKRSLYLKDVGYIKRKVDDPQVPDSKAWESLPVSDQLKRYRALAEKTTKLKSPLFFINPNRLSVRNLAKHVDEAQLKSLCVTAIRRGLDDQQVTEEDQIAHLRATQDITTRDILKIIEAAKEKNESIVPIFNEKNIKKFIPSVYINKDLAPSKKEKGVSRGFGFVDFLHHTHALVCMRELNNNAYYSSEYVVGGKKARDTKKKKVKKGAQPSDYINEEGRILKPRLIVDFAVENKKKAQQQVANRDKQRVNVEKQQHTKPGGPGKDAKKKKEKKTSRGALQRAKKRKRREEGINNPASLESDTVANNLETPKESGDSSTPLKSKKITTRDLKKKKRKMNPEDQTFEKLVESYSNTLKNSAKPTKDPDDSHDRSLVAEKRWYD